jgi:hypothetical protein
LEEKDDDDNNNKTKKKEEKLIETKQIMAQYLASKMV